jgi:acetolactate synthase-1/2/3 large subunit
VGVESPGKGAKSMLELTNPSLDWVQIAQGQGVPATSASTFGEFQQQFLAALNTSGPALIEVML